MAIPGDAVYRGKITVQNSKVSGSSDHSNFPVLLTEDNFWAELMDAGSESATNGGGGLRFSSDEAGAIQLAHEVVSFVTSATEGSRAAEVWIKAPTLAYSTDTDIHVWSSPTASEEAATSTYGSEAVWADYEAVLHLNDASTIVDSTGNRTPTLSGTLTSVDGPWGDAIQFGGSQYITLADDAGLDSLTGTVQNRAISMLLNFTTTSNLVIAEKGTNKHFVTQTFDGSHAGKAGFRTNTTSTDTAYGPQINNGAWHLFRGGQDNVNNYAVADTVKVTKLATASAPADDGDDFVIGSRLGSYGYTGKIKELRLRNQWPSDDWDATEYNNLLDPAAFAIAGTFQTGGGTTHETTANSNSISLASSAADLVQLHIATALNSLIDIGSSLANAVQAHGLSGSGSESATGSTAAALSQVHSLAASASSVLPETTVAAAQQIHALSGASSSVAVQSTLGNLASGLVLTAMQSELMALSLSGDATQVHGTGGSDSVVNAESIAAAAQQEHQLTGFDSLTQLKSTLGDVGLGEILTALQSVIQSQSSLGNAGQDHALAGSDSLVNAESLAAALQQIHGLGGSGSLVQPLSTVADVGTSLVLTAINSAISAESTAANADQVHVLTALQSVIESESTLGDWLSTVVPDFHNIVLTSKTPVIALRAIKSKLIH